MTSFGARCLDELGPNHQQHQSEEDDDDVKDEEETVERQCHDAPLERVALPDVSLVQLRHERPQHSLHLSYFVNDSRTDLDSR